MEVAAAMRQLAGGLPSLPAERGQRRPIEAPASAPRLAQMGACLDLLRQAGMTLERAANVVCEDRLILWQTEEVVAGLEDASPVAFASDQIALALREIGLLSEWRITQLAETGSEDGAGSAALRSMAGSFNGENSERARASGFDREGIADPAVPAVRGTRRLLPMAGTTALVVAIECLAATNAAAPDRPERAGDPLAPVRRLLRERIGEDGEPSGMPAADLPAAAELVRSGELAAAPGLELPFVVPATADAPARPGAAAPMRRNGGAVSQPIPLR
jgi:histidine ammonia-lyase